MPRIYEHERALSALEATAGQDARGRSSALAGRGYDEQMAMLSPVMMRGASALDPENTRAEAGRGVAGSGDRLPYFSQIQRSFGDIDLGQVQAHTGPEATRANQNIGARAYAMGNNVAFGQSPDLFTAAHEAAHVVQQRAGVQLSGGVGQQGDSYERHADAVASRVVQGQSAVDLLSPTSGHSNTGHGLQMRDGEGGAVDAGLLSGSQISRAVQYNQRKSLPADVVAQVGAIVGAGGVIDADWVQKVAAWQLSKNLDSDGMVGDMSFQWLSQESGGGGLTSYIKNEKLVYLGFNPTSRKGELGTLVGSAGSGSVTSVTGSSRQDEVKVGGKWVDLSEDEGIRTFLSSLQGLTTGKAAKLVPFLNSSEWRTKDELAQFVQVLQQVEMGQVLMKRLCMSGHSWGASIWGDDNGTVRFDHLARLAPIFPIAFGQVEDLMFSACNTGQIGKLQQYHAMFPNLKTIWAYADYSPSGSGARKHIKEWEKTSRGAGEANVQEGRKNIAKQHGKRDKNVVVWGTESGYATASPHASSNYSDIRRQVDAAMPIYTQAFVQGNIDRAALGRLQSLLQNLTGNHGDSLGAEKAYFEKVNLHVLYLRHWANISRNFQKHHGTQLAKGYQEAGVTMPTFCAMTRAAFLAHLKTFETAAKGGDSQAALKLLREILRDLTSSLIPDNWN